MNIDRHGGSTRWYAMARVRLGGEDEAGHPSTSAWRAIGFDLDHRVTTAEAAKSNVDVCKAAPGASPTVLEDGEQGIDNAFGAHIVPFLRGLKADVEEAANSGIAAGDETILLRIDDVAGNDDASAPGALYVARGFDGARWPVVSTSLLDGVDLNAPRVVFPDGYVSGGTWVSGSLTAAKTQIDAEMAQIPVSLGVDAVQITLRFDDGAGTIAGFATKETLHASLEPALEAFGVCPGNATHDQLLSTLDQAADLVAGAPDLQNPSKPCDAISFALAFAATSTNAPTEVIAPPTPQPSSCN